MPKTKDAFSRYMVIDEVLRNWKPVKTEQLARICSDRIGKPISQRSIQKDIDDMRFDTNLNINAPINYDTKRKAFYYDKGAASILFPTINLSDEEITALLFYLKASNHYKEYKIFSEISVAIEKVLDATKISDELKRAFKTDSILETEKILPLKGSELIYQLIFAVRERRIIQFDYKRFDDDKSKPRKLNPLLLKEVSQMWYIIGSIEGSAVPVTFAIDRMTNLQVLKDVFEQIQFNSTEHFKHSLGITVSESEPMKIVLQFTKQQGNYIKALPIHESQQIEKDNRTGLRISINVKHSYELISKILGYGPSLKVISPNSLRTEIKTILKETVRNY